MGFFGNIGVNAEVGVYQQVVRFLKNVDGAKFSLIDWNAFNYGGMNVVSHSFKASLYYRQSVVLRDVWDENISEEHYNEVKGKNQLFIINPDYTVSFRCGIKLYKINASEIPFKLGKNNMVCLQQVKDDIFDWLPEEIQNLWILNAYRSNKTISFKNLKHVDNLGITGIISIVNLEGLEDVTVSHELIIKNCKKLKTTTGAPTLGGVSVYHDNNTEVSNNDRINVNIMSCPALTTLDFPRYISNREVTFFINDKSCPSISKIDALPPVVGYLGCKTLHFSDIKAVTGSTVKYVEVADYKGKGDVEIVTNSREGAIEKLKEIIANVAHKGWRMFDDLYAVASYFGLLDYFTQESTRHKYELEPSRYVENGMIHSYDPVGEPVSYGYYGRGVSRNNIKKGVCNYLNQMGIRYEIINTDPKKKKEHEYIKVL